MTGSNNINLTRPAPGYYLVRLVKKGWQVPAIITEVADGWSVEVDGVPLPRIWTEAELEAEAIEATIDGALFAHPLLRVVMFGERCDEATYRHRSALRDWARVNQPGHPSLQPTTPMDPATMPADDF